MKKNVFLVVGTRPNFMKIAPLLSEMGKVPHLRPLLVHTGQHYDFKMSEVFFRDLQISWRPIYLGVRSGSHASQTAAIMIAFEKELLSRKTDLVVVVGDVNSTLACSLVAAKMGVRVAHVEAGLRSFDRSMPEELNRMVTDAISDYLFVSEPSGLENLRKEGIPAQKIFYVGNIMIDSLKNNRKAILRSRILQTLRLQAKKYAVITLHRPSNVDHKNSLLQILSILKEISKKINTIYSVHPRSWKMIRKHGLLEKFRRLERFKMIQPLGYVDFIRLIQESLFVLTDSGGIQEETTYLKIPCLTMRENTERPATIHWGSNELVGTDKKKVIRCVDKILCGRWRSTKIPPRWDGRAAKRIVRKLARVL